MEIDESVIEYTPEERDGLECPAGGLHELTYSTALKLTVCSKCGTQWESIQKIEVFE